MEAGSSQWLLRAVLVTDLVGSTVFRESIGEPAANEFERLHEQRLTSLAAQWGGELVNPTGDGAILAFPTAADALECAVTAQWRSGRSPELADQLEIRMGLSLGELERSPEGDLRGRSIALATRLCNLAGAGELLATSSVGDVGIERSGVTLEPMGPIDLKGFAQPVDVVRARWPFDEVQVEMGLPETVRSSASQPFVGRKLELEVLREAWRRSQHGGRVLLLAGEAGIGKTCLAARLAAYAHERGATVLHGMCEEAPGTSAQPLVACVRQFVDAVGVERARTLLGDKAEDLAALCPELSESGRGGQVGDASVVVAAIEELLRMVTLNQPTVVVLDDVQWATAPIWSLLQRTADQPAQRMLIIATTRLLDDASASRFLDATASRGEEVEVLEVRGLGPEPTSELVRLCTGRDEESFGHEIFERTNGNPLLISMLSRHLARGGRAAGTPEGVQALVQSQLAHLSESCGRTMTTAAVIGMSWDIDLLVRACGESHGATLQDLDELTKSQLLERVDPDSASYRFKHTVFRDAVYEGLDDAARAKLHHLVARALADDRSRASANEQLVAHHMVLGADLLPATEVRSWCLRAASSSSRQADAATSARWLVRAAQTFDDDAPSVDAFRVRLELGCAQRAAGHPDELETLLGALDLARRIGSPELLAEAALALNPGTFRNTGRANQPVITALEEALDAQPAAAVVTRARLLATLACELAWSDEEGRRFDLSDDALRLARSALDDAAVAQVLLLRLISIVCPHTLEERRANSEELERIAARLGDDTVRFWSACHRSGTAQELGDYDTSYALVDLADRIATRTGQPGLVCQATFMRAATALAEGGLSAAERHAHRAHAIGLEANLVRDAELFFTEQILDIRRWQDRLAEHSDLFAIGGDDRVDLGYVVAGAALDAGDMAAAEGALDRILARPGSLSARRRFTAMAEMCNLARLVTSLDRPAVASELYEQLLPYAQHHPKTFVAHCVGHHYLGLLAGCRGHVDLADEHFACARDEHVRVDTPLLAGEVELEWGALLRRTGRQEAWATSLLSSARERGIRHGAPWLVRRSTELSSAR